MRRIAAAALAFALAACGRGGPPPVPASRDDTAASAVDPARGGARSGRWLRAEGERDGKPLVWEFRDAYAVTPTRVQLLNVSWHYATARADGQPEAPMQARFAALEAQLQSALGASADLVATLDYDGQHDWYWYADSAAAYHAVRALLPDDARRDIVLSVEPDPRGEFRAALEAELR